jgi:hypothetical protein
MKTITLVDTEFQYNSQEELELILKKYPNIKFLGSYEIGDYFTAGDRFTAGDYFTAGNHFTAGYRFTAGDYFTAGDRFTAGDYFTAGYRFTAGDYFTASDRFTAGDYFTAGNHFTAGYRFTTGDRFTAGDGLDVIKCFSGNGMYKYHSGAIITKTGEKWIILGCFCRKLGDWEKEFWNNDKEFPNDGSEASENRLKAYKVAKYWLELNS